MEQGRVRERGGAGRPAPVGRSAFPPAAAPVLSRRRPRGRGWPRLALLGVILAVVLGVLAMHQLRHPAPTGHLMGTAATAAQRQQVGPVAAAGMAQLEASTSASPQHEGGPGGCLSCGDHPVVMALCVLALALLVLAWRLPRPRSRLAPPPGRRPRPSRPAEARRLPRLTLAELSVCRT